MCYVYLQIFVKWEKDEEKRKEKKKKPEEEEVKTPVLVKSYASC